MQHALVTGGCGFLGSWIAKQLDDEGVRVRVLAVPGEPRDNLEGHDVEVVEGDITNPRDAERVVAGVDTLFHAAALYTAWQPDQNQLYHVNVMGTFHMLEAARRAGVERVIHTASVVSLGRPLPGAEADADTPYECWDLDFPYSRSKLLGRKLCEGYAAWGLDVRVVCPGVLLGPGDRRPTPSGRLIINAATTKLPATFDGGASYIDVRDAATVHIRAAQCGQPAGRYLATAYNLTNQQLVAALDRVLGRKRRLVRLPVKVARGLCLLFEAHARLTGQEPLLTRTFFEYSLRPSFYHNDATVRELGVGFRSLEETLRDAIAYFRDQGMLA